MNKGAAHASAGAGDHHPQIGICGGHLRCSSSSRYSGASKRQQLDASAIAPAKLKPRAVVALDHDDIGLGFAFAQLLCREIFGRTVASERDLVVWKFEHHDAAARPALHDLVASGAHQMARAELTERRLIG